MGNTPVSYVEKLATELAGTAIPTWFHANTAWADVLRLAFRYLDFDVDGVLGSADLMRHISGEEAEKLSGLWLQRWMSSTPKSPSPASGISFSEFRMALWSTLATKQLVEEQRA